MTVELGIGQVGLGSITTVHREAYRKFGQPVVAGYDPSPEARERFAADSPSAEVYESLDALLADPDVGVVDIATPQKRAMRLPAVTAVAEAGKPMLIQKPLAYTYDEAAELADVVGAAGVTAMVNQNMCFTPGSIALTDALMRRRSIGDPQFAQVSVQYLFDLDEATWFGKDDRWWTGALTVHHFGFLQLLFGPPETVYAVVGHDPSQPGVTSDGYGHLILRYRSGHAVAVTSTGTYYGIDASPHGNEKMWIQGDGGVADWRPEGSLTVSTRAGSDIERETTRWPAGAKWFPDAFGLTMVHLRQALAAGETPFCSIDDNLYVMAVVEGAYRSSAENRVVPLAEIMGDRYDPSYGTGWSHGYSGWTPAEPST